MQEEGPEENLVDGTASTTLDPDDGELIDTTGKRVYDRRDPQQRMVHWRSTPAHRPHHAKRNTSGGDFYEFLTHGGIQPKLRAIGIEVEH
ncbi:MAG: hypothetical protein M3071_21400, partial [Actinomycetota bacterium]|nr:hypothetical protein [Actinomycetota bacterium]